MKIDAPSTVTKLTNQIEGYLSRKQPIPSGITQQFKAAKEAEQVTHRPIRTGNGWLF